MHSNQSAHFLPVYGNVGSKRNDCGPEVSCFSDMGLLLAADYSDNSSYFCHFKSRRSGLFFCRYYEEKERHR